MQKTIFNYPGTCLRKEISSMSNLTKTRKKIELTLKIVDEISDELRKGCPSCQNWYSRVLGTSSDKRSDRWFRSDD